MGLTYVNPDFLWKSIYNNNLYNIIINILYLILIFYIIQIIDFANKFIYDN